MVHPTVDEIVVVTEALWLVANVHKVNFFPSAILVLLGAEDDCVYLYDCWFPSNISS